jgi:hypothetical protein
LVVKIADKLVLSILKGLQLIHSEVVQSNLGEGKAFLKQLDCMKLGLWFLEGFMLHNLLLEFVEGSQLIDCVINMLTMKSLTEGIHV